MWPWPIEYKYFALRCIYSDSTLPQGGGASDRDDQSSASARALAALWPRPAYVLHAARAHDNHVLCTCARARVSRRGIPGTGLCSMYSYSAPAMVKLELTVKQLRWPM